MYVTQVSQADGNQAESSANLTVLQQIIELFRMGDNGLGSRAQLTTTGLVGCDPGVTGRWEAGIKITKMNAPLTPHSPSWDGGQWDLRLMPTSLPLGFLTQG